MKKRKVSSNSKGGRRRCSGAKAKAKDVCIGGEEEDRISELPDDILGNILYFLWYTEDAVRTSLLSKRWRYVWTSVPSIRIDIGRHMLNSTPELEGRFIDFVDSVLRLNVVCCLRKFVIFCDECYYDENNSRIIEWINAVNTRNVEEIKLSFDLNQQVELPPSFFTCNKVMVLKLHGGIILDVRTPVCLPNLKVLELYEVSLCNEVSMKNLLEGCPVLEELEMNCCYYFEMETLFLQSSSLNRLRIDNEQAENDKIEIFVDAMNLERLNLTCDVKELCDLKSLSSLITVKLHICHCTFDSDSDSDSDSESTADVYGNNVVEILRNISNTKYMCLSEKTMDFLQHAHLDNLPMFHNLTRLEVVIGEHSLQVLLYLLQCSPNLLALVLRTSSHIYQHKLHQQVSKPKCLMLSLQDIEIGIFNGCTDEMDLVSYFLENATVLNKMSIRHYFSGSERKVINKKLLMLPRSSSACQIVFK